MLARLVVSGETVKQLNQGDVFLRWLRFHAHSLPE
jgi:hypothetical protein